MKFRKELCIIDRNGVTLDKMVKLKEKIGRQKIINVNKKSKVVNFWSQNEWIILVMKKLIKSVMHPKLRHFIRKTKLVETCSGCANQNNHQDQII
uniref:Uncharacterized protein n=1 Tax=Meloidogyne incognita TaxID=6306 RepID=A0A914L0V3_MELIC